MCAVFQPSASSWRSIWSAKTWVSSSQVVGGWAAVVADHGGGEHFEATRIGKLRRDRGPDFL